MNKIKLFLVSILYVSASSCAIADTLGTPPGSGIGLGCSLCDIHSAPEPQKPAEPGKLATEFWYFTSFGNDAGVHGPYISKKSCDEARRLIEDTDRCFKEMKIRPLD